MITTETLAVSDEEFLARFGDAMRGRPQPPWLLHLSIVALAVLAAAVLLHSFPWTV